MSAFDARRARAKRPLPLWSDAFLRDTMALPAEAVGGYMLLLMAMWAQPTCDLPDDDRTLATICRVSTRTWRASLGPLLLPFLTRDGGRIGSKRLRKEADFVELTLEKQGAKRRGKPLKEKEPGVSVDVSADDPTQQPNNLREEKKKTPPTPRKRGEGVPEGFEEFWADAYPHRRGEKVGKAAALRAYRKALADGMTPSALIAAARALRDKPGLDVRYTKDASGWLNGRRWEDEAGPPRGGGGVVPFRGAPPPDPKPGDVWVSRTGKPMTYHPRDGWVHTPDVRMAHA